MTDSTDDVDWGDFDDYSHYDYADVGEWETKTGEVLKISEMETSHLINTARLLIKRLSQTEDLGTMKLLELLTELCARASNR